MTGTFQWALEALLIFAVGCYALSLSVVVGGNVISRRVARSRPMDARQAEAFAGHSPSVAARLWGLLVEAGWQYVTVASDITRLVFGRREVEPLDRGTPVVVLPGYLESTGCMVYPGRWLRRQGFRVSLVEFPNTFAPIARNVEYLHEQLQAIRAETGAERVAVVAHSMGGVITRALIHTHPEDHGVSVLIGLASPHRGVSWAAIAPGRSPRDMTFGSQHTQAFPVSVHSKVPIHTVVASQDQIVNPPWASVTEEGETFVIPEPVGHMSLLFKPSARERVKAWLLEAGVEPNAGAA